MPAGVVVALLIAAGFWMLHHAKTTDPEYEPEGYKAWHWVLAGSAVSARVACSALMPSG
jgi:hypothetical protein